MKIAAFLERLENVRSRGAGKWSAQCPAHDDQSPSLSIREAEGKILLHCHAGCLVDSITNAVGVPMKNLFTDTSNGHPPGKKEYVFSYGDEVGKSLFQVVREELPSGKKTFKQRQSDGNDGWIWSIEGVPRVLY